MINKYEPYVGPRPFTKKDNSIFFGRDRETNELLSLIIAHPVVLLYAQSGAGKTSLLNAKIIPLLEERHSEVLGTARVNGELPEEIKSDDIDNIYLFNAMVSLQKDRADPKQLNRLSFEQFLKQHPHPTRLEGLSYRRVILFDQFEEIFTAFPERWRDRGKFFDSVGHVLEEDPRLRVVFAMREEYIANMDPFASALPERLRTRFRLERLREEGALQAVKKPLETTGRTFAPGVAEDLVKNLLRVPIKSATGTIDISGEFVEPVQLQVVCQKLWRALPPEVDEIDERYIEDYGDVDEALSAYYEDCIRIAAEQSGVKEGVLRRWFGKKLITSDGTRGTVYKDVQTTGGLPNEVVALLEDLRLVRPEMRGGAPWYELTHDRFIGPILQSNEKWFNQRVKSRMISEALEAKAKEWQRNQRPATALLSGDELLEAEQWLTSPEAEDLTVSDILREFVQASRTDVEHKRAEAQTRIATGLRRQRVVLALIVLIAVAMAFYTFRAQRQESWARRQAEDAALIERGNIAKSLAAQEDKQFDALLLGIKAVGPRLKERTTPPDEAVEGLRAAVKAIGNQIWLRAVPGSVREAVFSSDSKHILMVTESSLSVWDAVTGEKLFNKPATENHQYISGTFTPEGDAVLAQVQESHKGNEKTNVAYALQFLDAQSGEEFAPIFKGEAVISSIGFSQDRKRVAFMEGKHGVVLDTERGQPLLVLSAPSDGEGHIKLLPAGTHVYWRAKKNQAELWDINSAKQVTQLKLGEGEVGSNLLLSCSPDNRKMATGWSSLTPDYTIVNVWDAITGKLLISKRLEFIILEDIEFSPDSTTILAVGKLNKDRSQGQLVKLDLSTGQESTYKQFPFSSSFHYSLNKDGRILGVADTDAGLGSISYLRWLEYMYFERRRYRLREPRASLLEAAGLTVLDGFSGQELYQLTGSAFPLTRLSPDGSRLYFSNLENRAQIVALNEGPLNVEGLSITELFSVACTQMRFQSEYAEVKDFCESGAAKK